MEKFKNIFILGLFWMLFISCNKTEKDSKIKDVIIIGGGLSGLSTSFYLNNFDTLILEKNNRLGGRAYSKKWKNYYYDLGANVPVLRETYPFKINDPIIPSKEGYLWIDENRRFFCKNVLDCVSKRSGSQKSVSEARDYLYYKKEFNQLDPINKEVMSRFFNTWYPNRIEDNIPQIQRYFFGVKFYHRFKSGVGAIVKEFKKRIKGKILLEHKVISVHQLKDKVEVICQSSEGIHQHHSKVAVIATTPNIAKKLFKKANAETTLLLKSIKPSSSYGLSMIVEGSDIFIPTVLSPSEPFTFVCFELDKNLYNFLFFFRGVAADIKDPDYKKQLYSLAHKNLKMALSGKKFKVLQSDVHYWPFISFDVNEKFMNALKNFKGKMSERVFLGGDYTSPPNYYGMHAAMRSGKSISEKIKKYLEE